MRGKGSCLSDSPKLILHEPEVIVISSLAARRNESPECFLCLAAVPDAD